MTHISGKTRGEGGSFDYGDGFDPEEETFAADLPDVDGGTNISCDGRRFDTGARGSLA